MNSESNQSYLKLLIAYCLCKQLKLECKINLTYFLQVFACTKIIMQPVLFIARILVLLLTLAPYNFLFFLASSHS